MNMARGIKGVVEQGVYALTTPRAEREACKRLSAAYDFNGYKRIYFFHIRKTGGTSLNNMFLSLSGGNPETLYQALVDAPRHRVIENGLVFVGWNTFLHEAGDYFYGFSHAPYGDVTLPDKTFTFTCFRDPVRRVVSHYNMLMSYRVNDVDHSCMAVEGEWLGTCFDDFLSNMPKRHLLNQLYMFSAGFDVEEATDNVKRLSHYFFTEAFDAGVAGLNEKAGLALAPVHIRKRDYRSDISEASLLRLREMLEDEYRFLAAVRSHSAGNDGQLAE